MYRPFKTLEPFKMARRAEAVRLRQLRRDNPTMARLQFSLSRRWKQAIADDIFNGGTASGGLADLLK